MHDPTPILCRQCGAPIETSSDVALRCEHCGTTDELPRDGHARVRELRRRLTVHARRHAQISGFALGLATAFEDPRRILRRAAPAAAVYLCTGVGVPLFLVFGPAALSAYYFGRRVYFDELRPLIHARPPRTPTGRARCRCCAAEMPPSLEPLIRCRHCRTHSLVTPALQAEQSVALTVDARAGHEHHALVLRSTIGLGRKMDRVFSVAFVATFMVLWPALDLLAWTVALIFRL